MTENLSLVAIRYPTLAHSAQCPSRSSHLRGLRVKKRCSVHAKGAKVRRMRRERAPDLAAGVGEAFGRASLAPNRQQLRRKQTGHTRLLRMLSKIAGQTELLERAPTVLTTIITANVQQKQVDNLSYVPYMFFHDSSLPLPHKSHRAPE